jgi:uncharacterized protein YecE (DUF72 family)
MAEIRIGCSGWSYKPWRGIFYPQALPQKRWFEFYAGQFDTAEINASFYRLPSEATVANWAASAPKDFIWSWKASRYITHNKKLSDCADSIALVFGRMAPLGEAAPVLFQLPPNLHRNDARLATFLGQLPKGRRCAFEFRHASWYDDQVFKLLAGAGQALCLSDHHAAPSPWLATARFVYIRGHGPGGRYFGRYDEKTLVDWAARCRRWRDEGRDVFCYFDNDIGVAAPVDAKALSALVA